MRKTALLLAVLTLAASCHRDGLSKDQRVARRAAVEAVQMLADGDCARFVETIGYAAEMSEDYRAQMADLLAERIEAERRQRGNICAIEAVGDSLLGDEAVVFLQLHFADSTVEEIAFPLVRHDGKWKIR